MFFGSRDTPNRDEHTSLASKSGVLFALRLPVALARPVVRERGAAPQCVLATRAFTHVREKVLEAVPSRHHDDALCPVVLVAPMSPVVDTLHHRAPRHVRQGALSTIGLRTAMAVLHSGEFAWMKAQTVLSIRRSRFSASPAETPEWIPT